MPIAASAAAIRTFIDRHALSKWGGRCAQARFAQSKAVMRNDHDYSRRVERDVATMPAVVSSGGEPR